jgi:hypothetical protein
VALCAGTAIKHRTQTFIRAFDFSKVLETQAKQLKLSCRNALNWISKLSPYHSALLLRAKPSAIEEAKASNDKSEDKKPNRSFARHTPPYSTMMTPRIIV